MDRKPLHMVDTMNVRKGIQMAGTHKMDSDDVALVTPLS